MDRKWMAFLGVLLITVLFAAGMFAGIEVEAQKPAKKDASQVAMDLDVIILDTEGYKKDRKGPVEFSHRKHAQDYRVLCWECHHEYKGKENVWVPWAETKKCQECHDPVKKEITEIKLQKAYHLNCKGCHKTLAEEDKRTGAYRKCAGCHKKQS
jgi:hypothetical protein